MKPEDIPDNPYILLTPGPLSTGKQVRHAMLQDWCTWDSDYNSMVNEIRHKLTDLIQGSDSYTATLMQGSGTFSVESVIGSSIKPEDKLAVLTNGAYGNRIISIAKALKIPVEVIASTESTPPDAMRLEDTLKGDTRIRHVAVVHCETTTGILNPLEDISKVIQKYDASFILDAMSSFGGVVFDPVNLGVDFLISSANKCIQGAPGFGFVIATEKSMQKCKGLARSVSLDLYDQWKTMEDNGGKWRFTSPTHIVHAFYKALEGLEEEGGIERRAERYKKNQITLVEGMRELGFQTFLPDSLQSTIITSFLNPQSNKYVFNEFYKRLKTCGFVIYPGKVSQADTFRIGSIGNINAEDIKRFLKAVEQNLYWL